MSNTTDEYWEADGQSLHTYAHNIESLTGRLGVPSLRGEDDHIPFVPGERWLPKLAGPRVLSLGMWVIGADEEGIEPTDRHGKFNDNWAALRRLLWTPRRQIALTKRVRYTSGVQVLHGKAQFLSGLEPTMSGRDGAKFVVDLKMADPYFREAAPTVENIGAGTTFTNPGDDAVIDAVLTFSGGAGTYTLTHSGTGLVLTVASAGGTVVVDTGAFTAVKDGATNVVGSVSTNLKDGAMEWMHILAGSNTFVVGGGSCSISYKPVYL